MSQETETAVLLDPGKVIISKLNTRQPKPADVAELMESIRHTGQISPAIVRPHPAKPGHYELAAGARRKVACQALKRPLRAIIREIADADFEDMILTDNLQREDPDPMAEAILIERRLKAGVPATEIAARYGKSETWLKRRLKLAALTPAARDAWCEDGAFSHFTTEMMEFVGTLPKETQDEWADDPWDMREYGSLKDLIDAQNRHAVDLSKANWLNDPVTFVDGCGPGCASNSAESLFPDPNASECGTCTNPECFKKRLGLLHAENIRKTIGDTPITDFIHYTTEGYSKTYPYGEGEIRTLTEWDFRSRYSTVKKATPGTVLGLDLTDPGAPKITHLKLKAGVKPAGKSSGKAKESREDKLTGKRMAHIHGLLLEHLAEAPIPQVPILNLVAAFGTQNNRTFCTSDKEFDTAWGSVHAQNEVPSLDYHGNPASREEVLWTAVKPILRQRLIFQKNSDLTTHHKTAEMRQIAALTRFPWEEKWRAACAAVPVPKSWGPGIDPITLQPAKAA